MVSDKDRTLDDLLSDDLPAHMPPEAPHPNRILERGQNGKGGFKETYL